MPVRLCYALYQPVAHLFMTAEMDWTADITRAAMYHDEREPRAMILPGTDEVVVEVRLTFDFSYGGET